MSAELGTALTSGATKVLMLGSGELGKEVVIEFQRLGVEVIAVDRYENAPAMQVAHRHYTANMLDASAIRAIIEKEKPDYIVPEIEAIATEELLKLEAEGWNVIPNARATYLTMNREGIRKLAAEELGLPTSKYQFAETFEEFQTAVKTVGIPCVVKPVMSSSGHGQSVIREGSDIVKSWEISQSGGRAGAGKVIVEGFVKFDYEITLLTVRHVGGTSFLEPIGHRQENGDYQESWQPQAMSPVAKQKAQEIAEKITTAIGGRGIFGVEMFIQGDDVIFSEISPRPHDTGMVTLISQDLSEFALHARAVLGLPVPNIRFNGPAASKAIVADGFSKNVSFGNLEKVLSREDTSMRLFGKGELNGHRRLGVLLARGADTEEALQKVFAMRKDLSINM